MTQLYGRAVTVTLGGQTLVDMQNNPDDVLRVRFETQAQTIQTPGTAIITISNLSDDAAKALVQTKQYTPVTLSAGYVTGTQGIIFAGKLVQARKWTESPIDNGVILSCADGQDAHTYAVVSANLKAGHTPNDIFDLMAKTMAPFGISKGYCPQLKVPMSYPRGGAFFGLVTDYLRTLAHSNQCSWSIQRGALQMVPATGNVPGQAIVLNSQTGLIGTPEQTPQGVRFRSLIMPQMLIDRVVQINEKDINQAQVAVGVGGLQDPTQILPNTAADGFYRVYQINCSGDTRGTPFYMDCAGIPSTYSGPLPSAATQSPFLYPDAPVPDLNKH